MADQIKQCSDTMSEHCLNVISGSVFPIELYTVKCHPLAKKMYM